MSVLYNDQQRRHPPLFNMDDISGRRPGPSDLLHSDGRLKPLEPPRNFGPLPGSSQVGLPGLAGPLPAPSLSRVPSGSSEAFARPSQPDPLRAWYESRDGPWTGVRVDARNKTYGSSPRQTGHPLGGLMEYRGTAEPSDCETSPGGILPSDSGYASGPGPSVGHPSVYGDGDMHGDSQSIAGHLADLRLPQGSNAENKDVLRCEHCKQQVKTHSELRKHENRHTKPFRCPAPGCDRSEGFATVNDRDRHVRSRHPDLLPTVGFKCTIEPCDTRKKIWPRADNFRQHLRRFHKKKVDSEDDIDQFRYREPNPDLAGLASAGVLNLIDGNLPGSHLMQPNWMNMDPTSEMTAMDTRDALGDSHILGGDQIFPDTLEFYGGSPMNFLPSPGGSESQGLVLRATSTTQLGLELQNMVATLGHPVGTSQDSSRSSPSEMPSASQDHFVQPVDLISCSPSMSSRASSRPCDEVPEPNQGLDLPETMPSQPPADMASKAPRSSGSLPLDQILDETPQAEHPVFQETTMSSSSSSQESDVSKASSQSSLDPEDDSDSDTSSQPKPPLPASGSKVDADHMSETELSEMMKSLQERGLLEKYIESLGYQKPKDSPPKAKKTGRPQTSANETHQHHCPEPDCDKAFNRACELKKHRKRHEKPYGCTYPQCTKKFGSKNDWKRHENSQHFQLEAWKCDEGVKDGGDLTCGRVLPRRETFRHHLQKDHGISDQKVVDQKLDVCRIGQSCEARFWCGFCGKVIEIKQGEPRDPAWSERFDHIDAHYTGRQDFKKCERSEWKDVSSMSLEALSERQDSAGRTDSRGRQPLGKRSRPGHDSAAQPAKKARRNQDGWLWECCHCNQYWALGTAERCMDAVCLHKKCDECREKPKPALTEDRPKKN